MIDLDSLQKLAQAPVHLISDERGMVIGNSQALALECIRLRAELHDWKNARLSPEKPKEDAQQAEWDKRHPGGAMCGSEWCRCSQ